jgi:hypothetical protein
MTRQCSGAPKSTSNSSPNVPHTICQSKEGNHTLEKLEGVTIGYYD